MGWPNNYVQGVYGEDNQLIGIGDGLGGEHYLKDTNITTKRIKVGVNHMPGWAPGWTTPGGNGGPWPSDPWGHVLKDRQPLKGEYNGATQEIVDQQLREMRDYGIDFIMADWFFNTAYGVSTTNNTIPASTGNSFSWAVWPGYDAGFQVGMKITATGYANWGVLAPIGTITGVITSYDSTSGVVTVGSNSAFTGSGTAGVGVGVNSGWEIQCDKDSTVGKDTAVGSLDYFIKLWKTSTVTGKPKLCLTWANATNASYVTNAGWVSHFQNAINNYFSDPDYLKIDGKPVIGMIDTWASMTGLSPNTPAQQESLITSVKNNTIAAGFPGLYFVAGITNPTNYWKGQINSSIVDAIYALNTGKRYVTGSDTLSPYSRRKFSDIDYATFGAIDGTYVSWTESVKSCSTVSSGAKKMWIPLSAGFDKSTWDLTTKLFGTPTLIEFAQHLRKGVQFIENNPTFCDGFVVIQSWNEHIEGSVVEPNQSSGFDKLQIIKDTLSC